jgi:hypothetical protein
MKLCINAGGVPLALLGHEHRRARHARCGFDPHHLEEVRERHDLFLGFASPRMPRPLRHVVMTMKIAAATAKGNQPALFDLDHVGAEEREIDAEQDPGEAQTRQRRPQPQRWRATK